MAVYTIYPRKRELKSSNKGKKRYSKKYYVEFKDPVTQKYGNHISVESLQKKLNLPNYDVTSKTEAETIVKLAIDKGLTPIKEVFDVNLSDYLKSFWDYDNSTYIKLKNAKSGKRTGVTQNTAKRNASRIRQHIILDDEMNDFDKQGNRIGYYLPRELMASELTESHIRKLEEGIILTKKLSVKTWHNILTAISVPIREMVREGYIKKNPLDNYDRGTVSQTESNLRALTEEEVTRICNYVIDKFYEKDGAMWEKQAFAILLGSATGMRQGEILVLKKDDIIIDDGDDYAMIRVDEAYAQNDGIKTTKSGKVRYTFCDRRLALVLKDHCYSDESDLIFQGKKEVGVPMNAKPLWKRFDQILEELDIPKKTDDGLATFHSLRHFANTKIISRSGANVADAIIGHESGGAMTQRYNQPDISIFKGYAKQVGSLLPEEVLKNLERLNQISDDGEE